MATEFTGFHSEIVAGDHPRGYPYLDKVYGLVRGDAKGTHLTLESSRHLIGLMKRFDGIASDLGVNTAPLIGYFIGPNGAAGRTTLHELAVRVGPDLKRIVCDPRADDDRVKYTLNKTLELHKRVWEAGFPIALDPVLANFCINSEGNIVYVDRMPPRQRLEDGSHLLEYPEPPSQGADYIKKRYFSPESARVIYAQTARDLVAVRPHLVAEVKDMIGEKLGQSAYDQIHFKSHDINNLLSSPRAEDADALRIIAAEATSKGHMSQGVMNEVYHHTHILPGGILPEVDDIQQAAALIRTSL